MAAVAHHYLTLLDYSPAAGAGTVAHCKLRPVLGDRALTTPVLATAHDYSTPSLGVVAHELPSAGDAPTPATPPPATHPAGWIEKPDK